MVESAPVIGPPPLANAAGTVKTVDQATTLLAAHVPRVMLGSYTWQARAGNDGNTYFEEPRGSLNSLGLPSPPPEEWCETVRAVSAAAAGAAEVWVSVAGFTVEEFAPLAAAALSAGADAVELNLGCPNVWDGGDQKRIFSYDPQRVDEILTSVVAEFGDLGRIGVKVSPIFDMPLIEELDRILLRHGTSFVTTMNTLPNCLAMDELGRPLITPGGGLAGLSGPAIKWVALGQVALHRRLMPEMRIVGVGGIADGRDLLDMLLAGANEGQVATAIWRRGARAYGEILSEFADLPAPAVVE